MFIFLLVTLYIDFFKYFLGKDFRSGLNVVPILLLANLFLGIYVNLSIWYKLTDKTMLGALVSFLGALLTIILNIIWIPHYGYVGSSCATLLCYASMAIMSYLLGRKYYPVNYDVLRVLTYIGLGIDLYLGQQWLLQKTTWAHWVSASMMMAVYLLTVTVFEKQKRNN
jgi:O-antigen/teichoic acid export membrane protein